MSRKKTSPLAPGVSEFDQPFRYPVIRSTRSREVARYFEIEDRTTNPPIDPPPLDAQLVNLMLPMPGEITLITGASGSGKSSLLASIRAQLQGSQIVDLAKVELKDLPIVDLFDLPLKETLLLLSKFGLSEAWSYLRLPRELSDGQQWRLKLAVVMEQLKQSPQSILLCDEFAALLDRITARIIAHQLGKWIKQHAMRAILATAQDDLSTALAPTVQIKCDFNRVTVSRAACRTQCKG